MLGAKLQQLFPAATSVVSPQITPMISPEHRSATWIISFAFTVGVSLLFCYQAAYSWEYVITAHANAASHPPPAKTPLEAAESNERLSDMRME